MGIERIICKIRGHKYSYNFGWMPTRCECKRCGMKWKTINNPEYIPGKSNPLEIDIYIWVEDKKDEENDTDHNIDVGSIEEQV